MVERREWSEFVEKYGDALYRYALAFLGSENDAKDATQDAFIKIFNGELRSKDKEKEWVFTIIRNTCRDRRRFINRAARLVAGQFREAREWTVMPVEPLTTKTKAALAALPSRQREIFILRHIHEFSTDETSEVLGISEGAVKSHLSRAVAALRMKFMEGGND